MCWSRASSVSRLASGVGLKAVAAVTAWLRLSPLGTGFWLLLLLRLIFFKTSVERGISAIGRSMAPKQDEPSER